MLQRNQSKCPSRAQGIRKIELAISLVWICQPPAINKCLPQINRDAFSRLKAGPLTHWPSELSPCSDCLKYSQAWRLGSRQCPCRCRCHAGDILHTQTVPPSCLRPPAVLVPPLKQPKSPSRSEVNRSQ
jgi:hypothetical protein